MTDRTRGEPLSVSHHFPELASNWSVARRASELLDTLINKNSNRFPEYNELFTFNSFTCLFKLKISKAIFDTAVVVANKTWTKHVAFMGNKLKHVSVTQIRTPWKYSTVVYHAFFSAFQGAIL